MADSCAQLAGDGTGRRERLFGIASRFRGIRIGVNLNIDVGIRILNGCQGRNDHSACIVGLESLKD